jgi:flavin-dependent dehydrogenase
VIDNTDVLGLEGDSSEVRGVRILRRTDGSAEERVNADLVVDATGRGSRMPAWLEAFGVAPPDEERVRVDISYMTGIFPRRPDQVGGDRVLIVGATPPNRRCGVAVAFEKDRFIVTLVGYLGERVPADPAGFADYARALPSPMIHEIVRDMNPIGPLVPAKFPHSQRRRYEELRGFPRGLLVFGDGLCSFNPIHGQGISVAALEAKLLGECLRAGGEPWQKFFAGAARIIDMPWAIAVGNDLRFEEVEGKRSRTARWQNAYIERLLAAATIDPVVALAFVRVVHLIEPLPSLFAPAVLLRVLRHGGARSEPELEVERLTQSAVADLVRRPSDGYSRELDAE